MLAVLVVLLAGLAEVLQKAPSPATAYHRYTEDYIDGAKWRWSWKSNEITRLAPFCPTCDASLIYRELPLSINLLTATQFLCERCSPRNDPNYLVVATIRGPRDQAFGSIEREIARRVRTGEYARSEG